MRAAISTSSGTVSLTPPPASSSNAPGADTGTAALYPPAVALGQATTTSPRLATTTTTSEPPRDNSSQAARDGNEVAERASLAGAVAMSIHSPCQTVLRGALLDELLRDNCYILRSTLPTDPPVLAKRAEDLWRRSRSLTAVDSLSVDRDLPIDYFISHCWQDRGLSKALALQFFFRWSAIARNVLVAGVAATAFLLWSGDAEYLPLLLIGCLLVEVCTLLGWGPSWGRLVRCGRRRRRYCGKKSRTVRPETSSPRHERQQPRCLQHKPVMVFLDRLCIHQNDRQLNGAGILALGGILRQSSQLLALWSPRYLDRLWCTFELAMFLAMGSGKDERQLQIVPLSIGRLWWLLMLAWSLVMISLALMQSRLASQWSVQLPTAILLFAAVGTLLPFRACRLLVGALHKQRAEAAQFSIHKTKVTNERDRQVLYATLSQLFTNRFQREPDGKLVAAPVQLAPDAMKAVARRIIDEQSDCSMHVFGLLTESVPAPDPRYLRWDEAVDEIVRERAVRWTDVNQFLDWRFQTPFLVFMNSSVLLRVVSAALESDVSLRKRLQLGVCCAVTRSVLGTCACFQLYTQIGVVAQSLAARGCGRSPVWDVLGSVLVSLLAGGVPWLCATVPIKVFHDEPRDNKVHPALQNFDLQGGWPEVAVRVLSLGVGVGYSVLLWRATVARNPTAHAAVATAQLHQRALLHRLSSLTPRLSGSGQLRRCVGEAPN